MTGGVFQHPARGETSSKGDVTSPISDRRIDAAPAQKRPASRSAERPCRFAWKALFLVIALFAVAGMACNPLKFLKNTPARNLPGIQAVTGPIPPRYVASVLDVKVPQSVAVSPDGSLLYVAEGDGERGVRVIDISTRAFVRNIIPPETTPGGRKPMSIALAPSGILFVVDRLRNVVDMYDAQGQWLGVLPDPPLTRNMWEPLALGFSPDDELYVTNSNTEGPLIGVYDANGNFQTTLLVERASENDFSFATGVVVGDGGITYVSDGNSGRVAALDADGKLLQVYGRAPGPSALSLPRGIAIDDRGYCYIADITADGVKVWDMSKQPAVFLFAFGDTGFADGEFQYPTSVAVDGSGRIYIADSGNDRVQIWDY